MAQDTRASAPPPKAKTPFSWRQPLALIGALSETRYWAYLLLLPSLLLVTAVIIYPVLSGINLSFNQFNLLRIAQGMNFIGLQHYIELFEDPDFQIILKNTATWVIFGSFSQFTLGLVAALALHRELGGRRDRPGADAVAFGDPIGRGRSHVGAFARFAPGRDQRHPGPPRRPGRLQGLVC
jgi:multiple sugar transport system permease protein